MPCPHWNCTAKSASNAGFTPYAPCWRHAGRHGLPPVGLNELAAELSADERAQLTELAEFKARHPETCRCHLPVGLIRLSRSLYDETLTLRPPPDLPPPETAVLDELLYHTVKRFSL